MWRFIKILLYIFLSLVLIIGGLYLYLFKLGGIEKIVNNKIASLIDEKYQLDISVGRIKGSYLSGLIIENVTVFYNDSLNRHQLLNLPRLSTSYSIANLWDKKFVFDYFMIDSAEITLVKDSSGQWVIPGFLPVKKKEKKLKPILPSFSIGSLGLNHLSVRLLERDDTLRFDDITIALALKGEENTFSVDVEQFEFSSNQKRLAMDAAGGKITFAENRLLFKDIAIISDDTRIKLDGNILFERPLSGQVDFAMDNIDLSDVTTYLGPKLTGVLDLNGSVTFEGDVLDGSVDIGGDFLIADFQNLFVDFSFSDSKLYLDTLYGTILQNCAVDGNGYIDFSDTVETYQLTADIKQFDLMNLVKNSFNSDLNGSIILTGESFRNQDLLLNLHTQLYESSFDEYPLQKASGNLLITTDSIVFLDSFQVDYFENIFYVTGKVDYSSNIGLKVTALLNNLNRYKGKLFIDQPAGRGYAEAVITGKTSDPDLNGFISSDSIWLYGLYCDSLYAGVDLKRFLTGKRGVVRIDFYDGTVWDVPYDTGYVFLDIDSNLISFDTTYLINPFSSLNGNGTYDYGIYPGKLIIDSMALNLFSQVFYNRANINVEIDSNGFDFVNASIGNNGARLSVKGSVNYDETMNLFLSLNRIPIEPWKNLFEESLMVDGILSCEALLNGTFKHPEFTLNAFIDSLLYRDLLLGNLSTGLTYSNKQCTIDSVVIFSQSGVYRVDGSFYIDLAFTADTLERFPELPMSINVTAADNHFDLVSLMMPSVEEIEGDFYANFILSGTPHKPHLEGKAYIKKEVEKNKKASLKYFDLEDRIYFDSVGISMTDNRIVLDNIVTYVYEHKGKRNEKKSYAFIDGEITVKSLDNFYYNLDINIPEAIPFSYELEDIQGQVKGKFHVEGDTPPLVTGNLEVVSVKYLVNFAERDEGSPIMAALVGENTWDLDIDIDILSNYWIKNYDIDAEFAGQINLSREDGVYSFIGELEILRGRGFLFDKTFRLEPGSRVIFEGGDSLNPTLDIVGYTHIAGSRSSQSDATETTEQFELGIHVTGTLEEPEINIAEDSDFGSREDILPLIVANYYSSDTTSTSGSFERRMADIVSSQMSQIGSRQLGRLGVETFEIDPYYTGRLDPLETRVTLGFYTSPNLYVYGRSAISGQSRQEVGFEYRFNKSFLMQGMRDEDELYHLNLKLHWEF